MIAWHATADLPKTIENRLGRRTISRYDLERDALWRITDIQKSGEAEASAMAQKASLGRRRGEDWIRNPLYLDGDAIDVAPERREYSYDNAGNRLQAVEWLDTLETLTSTYATNVLDQYITINEDDGSETLEISLSHDPDGNLSRFEGETDIRYEYDAENRLRRVRPNIPSEGDVKVEFLYEYLGRRVKKSVFKRGPAAWKTNPEYEKLYVYDGRNVIEEITNTYEDGEIVETASRYFVRGLDLSWTADGAGGIGGLLATVDPETSSVYYHLYGPNGNTAQLLSDKGRIAAHYEYDLFGKIQFQYGPFADQNPFRFSTKYFDFETGLVDFGMRYYDPYLARWTSRDPIGEAGGLNLYGFVGNDPVNLIDSYGLQFGVATWETWGPAAVTGSARQGLSLLGLGVGATFAVVADLFVPRTTAEPEWDMLPPSPTGTAGEGALNLSGIIEAVNARNAYLNEIEGSGTEKQCDSSEGGGSSGNTDPDDGEKDEIEVSKKTYRGGKYSDLDTDGLDRHHMPSKSSSPLEPDDGPAIQMDTADHRRTKSYGGGPNSKNQQYRNQKKELIDEGKFDDAFLMDVDDIRSKFGYKYDGAILEAIEALPK